MNYLTCDSSLDLKHTQKFCLAFPGLKAVSAVELSALKWEFRKSKYHVSEACWNDRSLLFAGQTCSRQWQSQCSHTACAICWHFEKRLTLHLPRIKSCGILNFEVILATTWLSDFCGLKEHNLYWPFDVSWKKTRKNCFSCIRMN